MKDELEKSVESLKVKLSENNELVQEQNEKFSNLETRANILKEETVNYFSIFIVISNEFEMIFNFVIFKLKLETEKKELSTQIEALNQIVDEKQLEIQTEKRFHEEKRQEFETKIKDLDSKFQETVDLNEKNTQKNVNEPKMSGIKNEIILKRTLSKQIFSKK